MNFDHVILIVIGLFYWAYRFPFLLDLHNSVVVVLALVVDAVGAVALEEAERIQRVDHLCLPFIVSQRSPLLAPQRKHVYSIL